MRDWRGLIGNRQLSPEAVDELAQHLEDTYQAVLSRGGNDAAAMKAVHAELASLDRTPASLDIRSPRIGMLERVRQFIQIDLRDALRRLRRSPGFTAVAVGVLAVGLGVNIAIFSLINAMFIRPLAVRAPGELVYIYQVLKGAYMGVSTQQYEELSARKDQFAQLAGAGGDTAWVKFDGRAERLTGLMVTSNYLDTLGVSPVIGRGFTAEEASAGAEPTIIITDELWASQFRRDPNVLGQRIQFMGGDHGMPTDAPGRDYTIVGVTPKGFRGTGSASAWLALDYFVLPEQRAVDFICPARLGTPGYPRTITLNPVGRLASGTTLEQAQAFVAQWGDQQRLSAKPESPWASVTARLQKKRFTRLPYEIGGRLLSEQLATALLVVAGIVLLIAMSNLIGLLLARVVTLQPEAAIRLALGASRWQIARHWLSESLMLAAAGGAAGIVIARLLISVFLAKMPTSFGTLFPTFLAIDVPLDSNVLLFSAALCLVAGLAIGLAPARRAARTNVLTGLQASSVALTSSRKRFRHWIVIPQICGCLPLLLVAGAVSRTLITSELMPPGYDVPGLVSVQFTFERMDECRMKWNEGGKEASIAWVNRRGETIQKITTLLAGVPSIESSAVSFGLPMDSAMGSSVIAQDALSTGQHFGVAHRSVSVGFLGTLRVRLLSGRDFQPADIPGPGEASPVIISRRLAEAMWPGRSPLGRLLAFHQSDAPAPSRWSEVVGVAEDILPAINDGWPAPTVYELFAPRGGYVDRVVARSKSSSTDALRDIEKVVASADPSAITLAGSTVADEIASVRFTRRLAVWILGMAGLLSVALAAIGLYGIVSYSLAQRMREFGVRAALGASARNLIVLVLREALIVASIGSVVGLIAAYAAVGLVSNRLVAIPSVNALIVLAGLAVVYAAVLAACYLPARRAARVDPLIVLRGL